MDLSSEDKSSRFSVAILLQSERVFKKNTIRKKSKDQMTGTERFWHQNLLAWACVNQLFFFSQPVGFETLPYKTNKPSYVLQTLLIILW